MDKVDAIPTLTNGQSGVERAVVVGKALARQKKQDASDTKMKIRVVEARESIRRTIEAVVSGCVYEVTLFHAMPWSPIVFLDDIDVVRGRLGKGGMNDTVLRPDCSR